MGVELEISRGEMVEHELTHFIERRDKERRQDEEGQRVEDLWMPSERAYFARLEEQKRLERLEFHEAHANRLRNTMGELVAFHEREAERYRNGHHEERSV